MQALGIIAGLGAAYGMYSSMPAARAQAVANPIMKFLPGVYAGGATAALLSASLTGLLLLRTLWK